MAQKEYFLTKGCWKFHSMMMLKIALRNISRHKARSMITLFMIVFGCVALIFVGGFFEDISIKLRESFIRSQSGHIQIYRRGFNKDGKSDPYSYLIENSDEVLALIQKIPEVKLATARFSFSGLISTGENTISFLGQGLESKNEDYHRFEQTQNLRKYSKMPDLGLPVISQGEGLADNDALQVILGQGLAQTMGAQVGSTITLLTNTVAGSINAVDVNVKGIFYTGTKNYDDIFLRLPIETTQKLLMTQSVESIVIFLNQTKDTNKVYNLLCDLIAKENLDFEVRKWEDKADFYNKAVKMFNHFYLTMRLVTGIVVVLGIFNTLNMSVMERISEIGTIMALGVRGRGVMKLFLYEGILLGFIGGVIGALVGVGVVVLVSFIGIVMPPAPGGTGAWVSTPVLVLSVVVSTFLSRNWCMLINFYKPS